MKPSSSLTNGQHVALLAAEEYTDAALADPSRTSLSRMRALRTPSCASCSSDEATVADRISRGQHFEYDVGDPSWGSLTYSFRSSDSAMYQSVRVLYIQPPLTIVDAYGHVIAKNKEARVFVYFYRVRLTASGRGLIDNRTDEQ